MRTKLSLLLIIWILPGCSPKPIAPSSPNAWLALGDSYTSGEGVLEVESWPVQLVKKLKQEQIELDAPTILAKTGWNAIHLLQAVDESRLQGPYRLVTVQIGVNDLYGKISPEAYRPRLVPVLQAAKQLAGNNATRVLVLSVPDYDYGPYRKFGPQNISELVDMYNVVTREEAVKLGMMYVDITTASRLAVDEPSYWAADQMHFSAKMYAEWVKVMVPVVKSVP
jgi:lysophospholipase L1-like esterase